MAAVAIVAFLAPLTAYAQWDTHWNESGPHPDSCIFNGIQFYAGDDVCVRPNVKQTCQLDGTLGPPEPELSCKAAQPSTVSITHSGGRNDVACTFRDKRFSVGAEVCSAAGAKLVCQPNGGFGAPLRETTCLAPLTSGQ